MEEGPQRKTGESYPPVTAELLERCLDRVALAIARDAAGGAAYLPIYERLEAELAAMRRKATVLQEIRARLGQSRIPPAKNLGNQRR